MVLPERLTGYGVTLHRWQPGDAERLERTVIESLDHLRPWMDWAGEEPLTLEQRRALLKGWEEDWRAGGDAVYAILVENDVVAGGCGLHRRRGPRALEIGYWTHPRFLGRGIATAATRLLLDAVFSDPGIESVEIHHDKGNLRSRRVPERLGFEFVGEAPDRRAAPAEVGIDCAWRMERGAWLGAPAR